MKKVIFLVLLISSFTVNGQKLKDLLYAGKLKSDSGTVIRKDDDLSLKIDTGRKQPVEPEKKNIMAAASDSSIKELAAQIDLAATSGVEIKDNNKIWKAYMDSFISALKEEVLTSKKIKSGTYYVLVDYEIGIDGQVSINNVFPSPENSFLQQKVKERLTLTAPLMNPVLASNGKPRKVIKKYNFNLTKN